MPSGSGSTPTVGSVACEAPRSRRSYAQLDWQGFAIGVAPTFVELKATVQMSLSGTVGSDGKSKVTVVPIQSASEHVPSGAFHLVSAAPQLATGDGRYGIVNVCVFEVTSVPTPLVLVESGL